MSTVFLRQLATNAYRSLMQQPLRSGLSTLGVIVGIVSIVTMVSLGEGAKRKAIEQIETLGIQNIIVRTARLTDSQETLGTRVSIGLASGDVEAIRAGVPGCETVVAVREVKTSFDRPKDFHPDVLGVSSEYLSVNTLALEDGRFLCDLDDVRSALVSVIGKEVAERMGPQGQVGAQLKIGNGLFTVIGVLKASRPGSAKNSAITFRDVNKMVAIPLPTVRSVVADSRVDRYTEIIVRATDKKAVPVVAEAIKAILAQRHRGVSDYQMIVPLELMAKEEQAQANLNMLLLSIAMVSLLVGGIGIMNVMLASVSERTHEVGVRRAIGANRQDIALQFLAESMLIAVAGGAIGLVLGLALIFLFSLLGDWTPVVSVWLLALSLAVAFLVGALAGLYPAMRASKMDPLEALRHN